MIAVDRTGQDGTGQGKEEERREISFFWLSLILFKESTR